MPFFVVELLVVGILLLIARIKGSWSWFHDLYGPLRRQSRVV